MGAQRSEWTDRQEIHDVVLRYCRGIDRLDFGLVRSAYHADAVDHHTGFDGSVEEYLAWVEPKLRARRGGTAGGRSPSGGPSGSGRGPTRDG